MTNAEKTHSSVEYWEVIRDSIRDTFCDDWTRDWTREAGVRPLSSLSPGDQATCRHVSGPRPRPPDLSLHVSQCHGWAEEIRVNTSKTLSAFSRRVLRQRRLAEQLQSGPRHQDLATENSEGDRARQESSSLFILSLQRLIFRNVLKICETVLNLVTVLFGMYQHPQSLFSPAPLDLSRRQLCVYICVSPHRGDSPLSSHELTLALSRQASTSLLWPQTISGT